jgi:hypothetical protein
MRQAWVSIYSSVQGVSHTLNSIPCQDVSAVRKLDFGWNIAVISDGAGSCKHSEKGSKYLCTFGIDCIHEQLQQQEWYKKATVPETSVWRAFIFDAFQRIIERMKSYAIDTNCVFEDLSSTLIMVLYNAEALLSAHIGDGRGCYLSDNNEWLPMFTPCHGEQVGETVFITTDFIWDNDMIDKCIETNIVIRPKAFSIMSDGMEKIAFVVNERIEKDGEIIYRNVNRPFENFFSVNMATIEKLHKQGMKMDAINDLWKDYLQYGTESIKNQDDDKSMIFAVLLKHEE